jgi:hypothetical protein
VARRRKITKLPPPTKGTIWAVVGPKGIVRETDVAPGVALVLAHAEAGRHSRAVALTVERRDLFGPAVTLFRVERDEDGIILTYTLSNED